MPKKFQDRLKKDFPAYFNKGNIWNSKNYHEQRLQQRRYKEKLNYTKENEMNKKSRKRYILWFSPHYSKSMKANVDKLFLCLINKHFPPTHKYRKIFDKNTIKISCSCMFNIRSKISTQNKKLLRRPVYQKTPKCNCITKSTCPLNGDSF